MKKGIIALVFLLLCCAIQVNATDYYAQADAEITTATLWDTNPAGGGTDLTWASLANGDVLYANNHAITIENDIGSASVTATLTTAAGTGTAGGSFTFNINTSAAKTLYVNVTAGTTPGLIVTGAGAGADTTELTIIGNITGGSAASAYGVRLEHTTGNIPITGTITGGAGTSSHGIYSASAGKFAVTGNATGATGVGISSASTSVFTVDGNCIGASSSGAAAGCNCGSTSSAYCVITGNIINGSYAVGVVGRARWTPTAPASDATGHYVKFDGGAASATYYGKVTNETAANEASKVATGEYFIKSDDGATTQGTATSGGGAWGW
jgi:hypothetical protein